MMWSVIFLACFIKTSIQVDPPPPPLQGSCGGYNGKYGNCTSGYYCQRKHNEIRGKCAVICEKQNCDYVRCPICKYNSFNVPCSCCKECYKGCNEPCGGMKYEYGKCAPSFTCLVTSSGDSVGVCVRDCTIVTTEDENCPPCQFGSDPSLDPCNCCPICRSGCNEVCGGPGNLFGKCEPEFRCDHVFPIIQVGTCKKDCNLPTSRDNCPTCSFGSYANTDQCSCCDNCFKGCDEPCGGLNEILGQCASPLMCDFPSSINGIDGICKSDCSAVSCRSCEHGSFPDPDIPCSCCEICFKGCNEECGGINDEFGTCKPGLVCDRNGAPPEAKGKCQESCDLSTCPNCPAGSYDDPFDCTCCRRCKKICNEECGGENSKYGKCAQGLRCEIPASSPDRKGTCKENCDRVICTECDHGSYTDPNDPCACCGPCYKGCNEECGGENNEIGLCKPGFECLTGADGTRVCKNSQCENRNCELCPVCELGSYGDDCDCCKFCYKKREEECGGENDLFGKCAPGLTCDVPTTSTDEKGTCKHDCSSAPDCNNKNCGENKCKFGSYISCKECCPVCHKGPLERCAGNDDKFGICSPGLQCEINQESSNMRGKCKSDCLPSTCGGEEEGESFEETNHSESEERCPNCPVGSFVDKCKCCPVCYKKCNESCDISGVGDEICAPGLVCKANPLGNPNKGNCK